MIRYVLAFCLAMPTASLATTEAELEALHDALQTSELMTILSEEGISQSDDLRTDMFPNSGVAGWRLVVTTIYAPEKIGDVFRAAFNESLAEVDVAPLLEFYNEGAGREIAALEIEARRAISSDEIEEASQRAFDELSQTESRRLTLLQDFAARNKLVERNVAGALNANVAFFRGLSTSEAFDLPEDQMLRDVWSREDEIRADTEDWVFGYMTMAYQPISDEKLQSYVDLSGTDAGRALNRAFFAGFEALFEEVSFEIGAAAARFSIGDEL
ncbi:MAG: hypothetical protein AAFX07_16045 [Pseudomonadota bacterium]